MATVTIRDVAWKLDRGKHVQIDCQACLLEIAALKAEEPFSDRPTCVSPVLAGFGRPSSQASGTGLRRMQGGRGRGATPAGLPQPCSVR